MAAPFYRECNEGSPKRLSARVTGAIFSKLPGAPVADSRNNQGDQHSYPLQKLLRSVVDI